MDNPEYIPIDNGRRARLATLPPRLLHETLVDFFLSPPTIYPGITGRQEGPLKPTYRATPVEVNSVKAMEKRGLRPTEEQLILGLLAQLAKKRIGPKRYREIMEQRKEIAEEQNQRLAQEQLTPKE